MATPGMSPAKGPAQQYVSVGVTSHGMPQGFGEERVVPAPSHPCNLVGSNGLCRTASPLDLPPVPNMGSFTGTMMVPQPQPAADEAEG